MIKLKSLIPRCVSSNCKIKKPDSFKYFMQDIGRSVFYRFLYLSNACSDVAFKSNSMYTSLHRKYSLVSRGVYGIDKTPAMRRGYYVSREENDDIEVDKKLPEDECFLNFFVF